MRFGILGPLEVWADGQKLPLGGGRQRALLLLLLLHPNEVVATDRLIDALWEGAPPPTANKVVQNSVVRLRRSLGDGALLTRPGGYLLRVGTTDAAEFERAVDQARDQAPAGAARTLREALALWRGRPLADVEYEQWAQAEIGRLEELRLSAVEERVEAELQLGEHDRLTAELTALVGEQPFRERLCAQLMLALYRSGRQADALETYADARRRLRDELGIEPGPELQELQRRILVQDPELGQTRRRLPVAARKTPLVLLLAGAALVVAAATAASLAMTGHSGSNPVLDAGAVATIAPKTNRALAELPLGGSPSRLVADGHLVWVANDSARTVTEIGTRSQAISGSWPLNNGFPSDLAAADGTAWIVDGRSGNLTKVEPAYGTVATTPIAPANPSYDESRQGPDPYSIAADSHTVWITDGSPILTRVNAASAKVVGKFDLHHPLDGAAVSRGSVWAISGPAAMLFSLNPRTDEVTWHLQIGASPGFQSPYPLAVAVWHQSVWILNGNTATVTQVDPVERAITYTYVIGVEHDPVRLTAGAGAVWVANSDGTVSRIDPGSPKVHTLSLGRPVEDIATADGQLWVTTGAGLTTVASANPSAGQLVHALPASSCSPIYYGNGAPRYLIVADLPLQGFEGVIATQATQAIQFVLRRDNFRAGPYKIGYQACDDSTAALGVAYPPRCATNAHTYTRSSSVIGVIGPLDSYCSQVEVPIANRASPGPLALISPTNTYVGLTHAGPGAVAGEPGKYYPTRIRNYVRIIAPDDIQAAADAMLAKHLGAHRIYVIQDQPRNGYGPGLAAAFTRAAHSLGLTIVATSAWRSPNPRPGRLAAQAARLHAQAVFAGIGEIGDPQIGTLIKALDASAIRVIAPDAFSEYGKLVQVAGGAARDVTVSVPGLPISRFPQAGKKFVAAFTRTVGHTATPYSVYAAQATQVLLDAIAHSNGTRNSVRAHLFTTKISNGIIGGFRFDRNGDTTVGAVTIYHVSNGTLRPYLVLTPNRNLLDPTHH
jgi:DNA-binding SARP family transcriptional activator/ABC-type branched-subunit amino acid transport system substrate-binding protein